MAVVTAGGLFSHQTQREDADAVTFLASFKIMLICECSVPLSGLLLVLLLLVRRQV